jgi:peptide/nickel transport system substrate-binding protein
LTSSPRLTRPSRYVGLGVTAGLLAAFLLVRGCPSTRENGTGTGAPRRGGQITASIRTIPRSFNRFVSADQASDLLNSLMQGRLVRINRATFEVEPWLAEKWESSTDGRTHTMHLRQGVTWSDGTPFTAADVLFSVRAAFDPKSGSVVGSSLMPGGSPIRAEAPDSHTVVISYAAASGPGIGLLDMLPILPKHSLEAALDAGTFAKVWDASVTPAALAGTGPFVLRENQTGQRIILERNPRYWRKAADGAQLPYLDRIVLEIVPEQNAELLRLQSGETDLSYTELRSEDYVPVRRAEENGVLEMVEAGVSTDADSFWFCLKPEAKKGDPRFAFLQRREFRQAISHAIDREEFAQTVFLGEAVPVWGPVTSGNKQWFTPNLPRYGYDLSRARELLKQIGLEDRNKNGVAEDAKGTEARFTVLTQRGIGYYERGTAVLREQAAKIGVAFDIVPLEFPAMLERMLACNYDAVYMRVLMTQLDPAGNLDFWISSGSTHVWNIGQKMPATEWEARIDTLMHEQAATQDPERRRTIFNDVQRIFAENVPVLHFAAPRLYYAHNRRLVGVTPSVMRPAVLWSADTLSVTNP